MSYPGHSLGESYPSAEKQPQLTGPSETSKLVQKEYQRRHDWVGKVIHWELGQKLEWDQT